MERRTALCPICRIFVSVFPLRCICGYHEVPTLITSAQYFNGHTPAPALLSNANALLIKVNSLLQELGIFQVVVTSGWRSPEHNQAIGGAKNSKHCQALAVDIADNDRVIGSKIMQSLNLLVRRGMAMEALAYCVKANGNKWVHLQDGLPSSGKTVFIPYAGPIKIT